MIDVIMRCQDCISPLPMVDLLTHISLVIFETRSYWVNN